MPWPDCPRIPPDVYATIARAARTGFELPEEYADAARRYSTGDYLNLPAVQVVIDHAVIVDVARRAAAHLITEES